MKKGIIFCWIALVLLVTSCSKTPVNATLIPKESVVVVSLDVRSLYKKADLQELKNLQSFQKIKDELNAESKQLRELWEEMLKDPQSTGINFRKPVFLFSSFQREELDKIGLTLAIKDAQRFNDFATKIFSPLVPSGHWEAQKEGSLHIGNFPSSKAYLAWDNEKLLILPGEGETSERIKELFSLKKEEQIMAIKPFKDFLSGGKDLNVWLNFETLLQEGQELQQEDDFKDLYHRLSNMQKDNYFYGFIDFGKEAVVMTTHSHYNKEIAKLMKVYNFSATSFDKSLLKYFKEKPYMAIGGAVNIRNTYEFYKNLLLSGEFDEGMLTRVLAIVGLTKDNVLNFLSGSFVLTVDDFYKQTYTTYQEVPLPPKEKDEDEVSQVNEDFFGIDEAPQEDEYTYESIQKERMLPVINIAVGIGDKTILEKFVIAKTEKENGYYTLPLDSENSCYLAYTDKILFMSNSPERVKDFVNGKTYAHTADSYWGKQIKKTLGYGFMDMQLDRYPQEYFEDLKGFSKREQLAFELFKKYSDHISFKRLNTTSAEFTYHLRGVEKNVLNTLIKDVDQILQQ